jgi:hypothetical protein
MVCLSGKTRLSLCLSDEMACEQRTSSVLVLLSAMLAAWIGGQQHGAAALNIVA